MAKYFLDFPETKTSVKVECNPLQITGIAAQYVDKQAVAFGFICFIREEEPIDGNLIGIVAYENNKPTLFLEENGFNLLSVEHPLRRGGDK